MWLFLMILNRFEECILHSNHSLKKKQPRPWPHATFYVYILRELSQGGTNLWNRVYIHMRVVGNLRLVFDIVGIAAEDHILTPANSGKDTCKPGNQMETVSPVT